MLPALASVGSLEGGWASACLPLPPGDPPDACDLGQVIGVPEPAFSICKMQHHNSYFMKWSPWDLKSGRVCWARTNQPRE